MGGALWDGEGHAIRESGKFEDSSEQALEGAYDSFLDQFETSDGQSIKAGVEEFEALEDDEVDLWLEIPRVV